MPNLKQYLRIIYVLLCHAWVVCCSRPGVRTKDVLLVRLDAIGDFIVWLDAACAYRAIYPQQRITVLVNADVAPLARKLHFWDEVIGVDTGCFKKNISYRVNLLALIRQRRFHTLVQTRFSRSFLFEDSIVLSSNAAVRVGMQGDEENSYPLEKTLSDKWYTTLISNPLPAAHELTRNAHLLKQLGHPHFMPGVPTIPRLAEKPLGLPEQYYVIAPGAGKFFRQWPRASFAKLSEDIYKQKKIPGVICGAVADKTIASEIIKLSDAPLIDFTGKTDMISLLELLRGAQFVISNETGVVHMSLAVGTKTVSITGGGHFGRFIPYDVQIQPKKSLLKVASHHMDCYGCSWQCRYPVAPLQAVPCINNISVNDVMGALCQD